MNERKKFDMKEVLYMYVMSETYIYNTHIYLYL
jgi:hypothetical protein